MENRVPFYRVTAMVLGCVTTLPIVSDGLSAQEAGESVGPAIWVTTTGLSLT
jgi:hypothetical protein